MKALQGKTYSANASDARASQRWFLIDANGQVLGRVATTIAQLLRGKGKPNYSPHMEMGDKVVVINAEKIVVTGTKETTKNYYRHSNYPGGLRTTSLREMRAKHPGRILEAAVKGMLPGNRLGKELYMNLRIFAGPEHTHAGQKPVLLNVARDGRKRGQLERGAATTGEAAE